MTRKYALAMCRKRETSRLRHPVVIVALLVGLAGMIACNGPASGNSGQHKSDSSGAAPKEAPGAAQDASAETPAPLARSGTQLSYNFDSDSEGQLPATFHSARTGAGKESRWSIISDPTAPSKPNAIAQTSIDQTDYRFPLLIADEASFRDLELTVKFKAVSGEIDRAGGLVFRLKDPNNYYVVRANALENNYNLYHVVKGHRSQFAGAKFKVTSGEWHELRVEAAANRITCYYDGKKKIEASDDTFGEAGKIGLWTKADSVTYFDDLQVTAR